jgi:cytochrome b pre-mRNA-processing protein 3
LASVIFAGFDDSLRELGVGDFGISRRIKAMAAAFYGRLQVYGGAASTTARAEAILKNLYRGEEGRRPEAAALAHYIELVRHALLERTDLLLQGKPEFGPLPQIRVSS